MRSTIAVVAGLVVALAIAIPAQARGGTVGGIVVAKQPARGTLVVVRPGGVGLAVSGMLRAAKVGDRVAVRGTSLGNGLLRATHIRVSGHVRRALVRGVVVRRLAHSLLVTTGGSVIRIRLQPRALSAASDRGEPRAGTIGEFRVRIDDDDLVEDEPVVPVGQAQALRIEGVVTSVSPLVVRIDGLPLTITVPAGMALPAGLAPGERIEATVQTGTTPNSFTLVSVDELENAVPAPNEQEVEAKGTVVSSSASQLVVNAGGGTITFNAPPGTTLPIVATGAFVEVRGVTRNGMTTLTRLRTEDEGDGDDHDGGGGDHGGGGDGH